MKRILALLLLLPMLAWGQSYPNPTFTYPSGANTPRTVAAQKGDVINVADYGTLHCNGSTDDSATINAAAAVWVAKVAAGYPAVLSFPAGTNSNNTCVVNTTVNLTGASSGNSSIGLVEGNGARIYCNVSSNETSSGTGICVDATGSNITIRDLTIGGNPAGIGLQIANTGSAQCGGSLNNVTIRGPFTVAALYNEGCEDEFYYGDTFSNTGAAFSATGVATGTTLTVSGLTAGQITIGSVIVGTGVPAQTRVTAFGTGTGGNGTYTVSTSGGFSSTTITSYPYAVILDGYNLWSADSQYLTISRSVPGNYSFNENVFYGSSIVSVNGGGIWLANSHSLVFSGADYLLLSNATTLPGVVIYDDGVHGDPWNLQFNLHMESSLLDNFLITGAATTPTIYGLRYSDHYNQATGSIFALDSGVTSVTLQGLDLNVSKYLNAPTVFDTAANYKVSAIGINLPTATGWSTPATFSGGELCLGAVCDTYKNPGGVNSNTASGNGAMTGAVTGVQSTAFGALAGHALTSGSANAFFGYNAGGAAAGSGSNSNTAVGAYALASLNGASGVVALGDNSGSSITTGSQNLTIGPNVASTVLTTGSSNILIGTSSAVTTVAASSSNEINIGGLLFYNNASVAAPAVTSCGGSPSIDAHANNKSGTVTVGTTTGTCTVTFAGTGYSTWAHCRVTSQSTLAAFAYSYTTTVLTVTATTLGGDKFDYDCDGY
jgi:hypothetical protein